MSKVWDPGFGAPETVATFVAMEEEILHGTVAYRPGELLATLYRRRRPVIRFGGYVYLLGPEANRFVFANSELFTWREAFDWLIPVDGATSMLLSDGDDHRRRRALVQPSMHHRQIADYLITMAESADQVIDAWRPGQSVDVYDLFRAAIRRTTLLTLFGPSLASDADFLGRRLQVLIDLCDGLPIKVVAHRRLRTPAWRKAMIARAELDERLYAEIARVRAAGPDENATGGSVLSTLVHGRDATGSGLTDEEIRDQVVTLIVAGYETTSGTMAWVIHGLAGTPGVWPAARREVSEVLGDQVPGPKDLARLPYLGGVIKEAQRLYPAVTVIGRKVARDFEYAGETIMAGTMVALSPYVTHRLPELWPDPLRFRPDRWLGGDQPKPYEFLPFGGGPHRCIGATMATSELTVMAARLLSRATLELESFRVRPTSMISLRPAGGLRARIGSVAP